VEVLFQLWVMYQLEHHPDVCAAQQTEERDATWYWQERGRLEQILQEVEEHPLVRSFPRHEVVLYEPSEVRCPHGLRRKACESVRGKLELLRLLEGSLVTRYLSGCESGLREELRKAGIDPAVRNPQEFCEPFPADFVTLPPEFLPTAPARGRPRNETRNQQILLVVGALTKAGVTVAEACGLLERMLRAYCGHQTDADALERQYRRLKYAASPPANSNARRS
jgi:hypothetical protein